MKLKFTPLSLEEIESELLNSLFANPFPYLIHIFIGKHIFKAFISLSAWATHSTASSATCIKRECLEVETVLTAHPRHTLRLQNLHSPTQAEAASELG